MNQQKWNDLTKEIQPLAEELCRIAEKYDLELPSITADADGYFTTKLEGGEFYRCKYEKEIVNEWGGED